MSNPLCQFKFFQFLMVRILGSISMNRKLKSLKTVNNFLDNYYNQNLEEDFDYNAIARKML